MKTSSVTLVLSALTASVLARPSPGQQSAVAANVPALAGVVARLTHLFVCDSSDFKGRCENLESNNGQCYNLFNGWSDTISSLGPDSGTTCTLWENFDCTGKSLSGIVNPGIWNLVDFGFNDIASSYRCS